MISGLRKNIDEEIAILKELSNYERLGEDIGEGEKRLIDTASNSLANKIKIINNSIPEILKNISVAKRLPKSTEEKGKTNLERVNIKSENFSFNLILNKKDREEFLKELDITEAAIKQLKRRTRKKEDKVELGGYKSPRGYLKTANKMFLQSASKYIKKGWFDKLAPEIRKANIDILFQSYVATILFTTFLSVFAGIFLTVILLFFNLSFSFPFISVYSGDFVSRLLKVIWIPLIVPILTFFVMYFYPSTEKGSIGKKIDQEIPFAVVHMSAISQSGIEPTKIFQIIGVGNEYPNFAKEVRKIINQINLYGYDLVTALNNVSKTTPSMKAAELFAGLSTTINSGGDLTEFFEKRAQTLLVGYRLEREKFTGLAETFMDIYISVVIATPMILLLLLIMISVSGISLGFSPNQMTILIIVLVAIINLIFVGVLHIKQPAY